MLRPILVANPYAPALTFLDDRTRTRRDHMKYLTLIRTIALLHQYQREEKTIERSGQTVTYIEVTLEDIAIANTLAHEVLGRSLDELAPQTRRLLLLVDDMVRVGCERQGVRRNEYRFTRREVREHTGWGNTQVRVHLERLIELEYVLPHGGSRGSLYEYELVFDGQGRDGKPFVPGLVDVDVLRAGVTTTASLRGEKGQLAGGLRGQNGPVAGTLRTSFHDGSSGGDAGSERLAPSSSETAHLEKAQSRTYLLHRSRGNGAIPSLAAVPSASESERA